MEVVGYTDCQQYLRDWLEERNQRPPRLSYEAIARQLGLRSRGHAHRLFHHPVVPISGAVMVRLMDMLELQGRDREYFEALVAFNRASRMDEKHHHFERLENLSGTKPGKHVSREGTAYLAQWFLPVLREAVCLPGFRGDFKELARALCSPLTEAQVRKGVDLLVQIGMLRKLPGGRYTQSEAHVHAGGEVEQVLLAGFQRQMLGLAEEALGGVPAKERHITTLTFSFPMLGVSRLKKLLTQLQGELVQEILREKQAHDSVWQFNLQLFPLLHAKVEKDGKNEGHL